MVNKAFAISCLDKQIAEKKRRHDEELQEDLAKDLVLELERLKKQKRQLEEEEKLKKVRLAQREVIIDQIKSNENKRVQNRDQIEKEGA